MIIAYHVVFGAYGFWLPNDPRGSWSQFVASRRLFRFGKATPVELVNNSIARVEHDIGLRLRAKSGLKRRPVVFNGLQARAVARGLAVACNASGYEVWACSIMPEHVHMVVRRHKHSIERMVGHFKARATQRLREEGMHPFSGRREEETLTVWGEKCWTVFLEHQNDIRHAIEYVEQNPLREGKVRQRWSFVREWGAGGDA